MCGVVGLSPLERITIKQLWIMYQSRIMYDWDHSCNIMAASMNAMGGTKAGAVEPNDLHPYRQKKGNKTRIRSDKHSKRALMGAFLGI